jgi:hypothetical protein
MVVGLAVTCLAALGGFLGAVWLLLFAVGDGSAPEPAAGGSLDIDHPALGDGDGPFIPMPSDLRTREEMVAWMTTELPRLTAALPHPRVSR